MRSFRFAIALVIFIVLAFALYGTSAQQRDADKIVMRDGKDFYGHLNAINEKTVDVDRKFYERAKVKLIRLSSATDPAPDVSYKDLVVMRGGKLSEGHVSRVTDKFVFQNNVQLKRGNVAVIKFADHQEILTAIPETTPSPTATPSPTPAP